jgi:hypothetical protein
LTGTTHPTGKSRLGPPPNLQKLNPRRADSGRPSPACVLNPENKLLIPVAFSLLQ